MVHYNEILSQYITDLFSRQDQALQQTLQSIVEAGLPAIQIKPEEGRFLQFLTRACGVLKAVEIGTLGGYSGIWIARGLLPGGKLITLEKEPLHARVARQNFEAAGVSSLVEIRVGDAHQLLQALSPEGPFDFVFIDAEKDGYAAYLDWSLENTRPNGLIAAHNAFRKGSVAGVGEKDAYTDITQAFNLWVSAHPHLISTIFPAGDGTLVAVKTG